MPHILGDHLGNIIGEILILPDSRLWPTSKQGCQRCLSDVKLIAWKLATEAPIACHCIVAGQRKKVPRWDVKNLLESSTRLLRGKFENEIVVTYTEISTAKAILVKTKNIYKDM